MNPDIPTSLLGGLTATTFMRRHWQRTPLLIRQALPGFRPPISLAQLRRLARNDEVESRLIWREDESWQLEHGPFTRLPRRREADWTLLVQGMDLHDDATAGLRRLFRFIPDARLDDIMISIAGDGGGVGPHFDSYDVFLLQAVGKRRWRYGRQADLTLEPDAPLKLLRHFQPEHEAVLEPGDMLYLPPDVAHDGVAVGDDCMTISVGFRSPSRGDLARILLETAADALHDVSGSGKLERLYRDRGQPATRTPAGIPDTLIDEALVALRSVRLDRRLAARALGIWLSEPKSGVYFDPPADITPSLEEDWPSAGRLQLDRRTRMLYSGREIYINGEPAEVPASRSLRQLADQRSLECAEYQLSPAERVALQSWWQAGWLAWVPESPPSLGITDETH